MKKLILLFTIALIFGCEKEEAVLEQEVQLEAKSATITADVATLNTFTGVFASHDMELHGELSIDLESNEKFAATVKLLNGQTLQFKAVQDAIVSDIVQFKGENGHFTLDFTDKSKIVASDFLVNEKEGNIKVYAHERGIPPGILFGVYVDGSDPTFTGFWDMITFGTFVTPLGPPFYLIEDLIITQEKVMYFDETFGALEPFVTSPCLFGPIPVDGGFTDGFIIEAIDQSATFAGVPSSWTIVGIAPDGLDPFTCIPLPPGIHGFWSRGARSGTITILSGAWITM